jgi:uncharacterized phage protein (TIGR01671 family)
MREVEFRGKSVDNGTWKHGFLTRRNSSWIGVFAFGSYYHAEVIPESVGQYTGLKDKNGEKIFEGDWCEAVFRDKQGFHVKQGNILMDEFMWCLDAGEEMYSINRLHEFKVMDNIHDNPELLKS